MICVLFWYAWVGLYEYVLGLYSYKDDLFAINLNKECDRILGNENSKQSKPIKTATTWRKNSKNHS